MRLCVSFLSTKQCIDQELVDSVSAHYGFSVPAHEVTVFSNYIKNQNLNEPSLIEIFDKADEDIFANTHLLLKILITIPQTSVTVERLFSSVKRIKTRLRSKMHTARLSALALLSFEKEISNSLNRDSILERFRSMKNRRLL